MNLGTQTGSLINHLASRAVIGQPEPIVGMGATVLCWTDRHACTVFRVIKVGAAVIVEVRRDKATLISGPIDQFAQAYAYALDVRGSSDHFRRGKDGRWTAVRKNESTGRWVKESAYGLSLGKREEYRDMSF